MEDQDADSLLILRKMRKHFKEFGDTCLVKEALRSIYATASNALEARAAFRRWATLAVATKKQGIEDLSATLKSTSEGARIYGSNRRKDTKTIATDWKRKVVVGDGFEPSKSATADLQSAPFGRSGIPPNGAGEGNRTLTISLEG